MAKFRRGADAIKQSAKSGGSGSFTPMLTWKAGEKKYVQFVTPLEEVPTVLYHNFIRVSDTDDGRPVYRSFISRRDPALDGPNGYDPIWDRGYPAKPRQIAVAVELEPVYGAGTGNRKKIESFSVKQREYTNKNGETVSVPAVGLIVQSHIFFGPLTTADEEGYPLSESVMLISRRGGDQNTAYDVIPVGDAIELNLPEEAMVDLDAYLDELSDEARVRELIDPLPDGWVLDRFAEKNRQAKAKQNQRTAPVEEEAPEPSRDSRFARMRQEMTGQ